MLVRATLGYKVVAALGTVLGTSLLGGADVCVMLLLGAVLEGGGGVLLICVGDCVGRSLLLVDGMKLGASLALKLGGMLLLLGRTLGSAAEAESESGEPESSSLKDMVGAGLASITLVLLLLG